MIKYLGSKRLLLPHITAAFRELPNVKRVADLFSGTARVGRALRAAGYEVFANDQLRFSATLARCYVQASEEDAKKAVPILTELGKLGPEPGYFTQTFCEDARYFHPKNGAKVDAIRNAIEALDLTPEVRAIVLVSLMEAADRVDSTTGVQMAYLKKWAKRAHNDLALRLPELVPGKGHAREGDAAEAAAEFDVDALYLDPPYNQHSYLGNYHIWETLVRWDAPEAYGIAKKRIDCRERKSDFNSKRRILDAFTKLVKAARAPHLVVSFSNEGYLDRETVIGILGERGHVGVVPIAFGRYVGARIGIHNPQGKKVGTISHTENKELIFVVSPDADAVDKACRAVEAVGSPLARRQRSSHMASS